MIATCIWGPIIYKMRLVHGLSRTPEYRIWAGIKQRCCNPARHDFDRYGGAGIGLCKEWAESFSAFFDYVGPRPTPKHSIDRIDGSKGYEPGNVRWATPEKQAQNSSLARPITLHGRTLTASEWSRETGLVFTTIIARMNRGLSPEEILHSGKLVGLGSAPRSLTFEGKEQTLSEWAKEIGITKRTLKKRLNAGIPLHRALKNPMPEP